MSLGIGSCRSRIYAILAIHLHDGQTAVTAYVLKSLFHRGKRSLPQADNVPEPRAFEFSITGAEAEGAISAMDSLTRSGNVKLYLT